ncbi:Uncharacterised protein [Clostridium tertium]|uniref:Uncharacterized protein n=1 Tax=Clostridium tertium TaxID=1559 RepID=A0A6N2Z0D4_9CLOT
MTFYWKYFNFKFYISISEDILKKSKLTDDEHEIIKYYNTNTI